MIADLDALRANLGTVSNISNATLEWALTAGRLRVYEGPPRVADRYRENPAIQLAVILDASRLYKRRQSPEGVAGWGDLGVVRIMPRDPDIEALRAPYLDMCDAGVS